MKGKGMKSPKGLYSTKDNPMAKAKKTEMRSSGVNADAAKIQKLHKKAYNQCDSLRIAGK